MSVLTQIRNWFNLGTEETEDVGLDALTDELSLGDIEVYESLGVDDYDGENIAEAPDEDPRDEDEDTDDTLNQEVADELDRELVEDEEEDAESSEVDGSSQDAASTETVEDSEVEN